MKNKRGKKLQINFSNRWLYTFILIGLLIIVAVGVSALTAGTKPNPGHSISEMGVPSGCTAGQVVSWDGSDLICKTESYLSSCHTEEEEGSYDWGTYPAFSQGYVSGRYCSSGTIVGGGCICNGGSVIASVPTTIGGLGTSWYCACEYKSGNKINVRCCT